MNMKRPLLADVINVCTPIQNIQIIDKTTNDVIAEGKAVELTDLLDKYDNNAVYRIEPHNNTLLIEI